MNIKVSVNLKFSELNVIDFMLFLFQMLEHPSNLRLFLDITWPNRDFCCGKYYNINKMRRKKGFIIISK